MKGIVKGLSALALATAVFAALGKDFSGAEAARLA